MCIAFLEQSENAQKNRRAYSEILQLSFLLQSVSQSSPNQIERDQQPPTDSLSPYFAREVRLTVDVFSPHLHLSFFPPPFGIDISGPEDEGSREPENAGVNLAENSAPRFDATRPGVKVKEGMKAVRIHWKLDDGVRSISVRFRRCGWFVLNG